MVHSKRSFRIGCSWLQVKMKCPYCGRSFAWKGNFNRHVREIHGAQKRMGCESMTGGAKRKESEPSKGDDHSTQRKRQRRGYQEVDPLEPVDLPEGEDDLTQGVRDVIKKHWSMIKTGHRLKQKLQDIYNYRMKECNVSHLKDILKEDIMEKQSNNFKLNFSFGFILRNLDTEQLRFFHPSNNEGRLFEEPHLIRTQEDFDTALADLEQEDILEWVRQNRPNSKWVVVRITNLTVYITKILNHPIGCSTRNLPSFIKYNRGVYGLLSDPWNFNSFKDNKCFFRALAMFQGACSSKDLKVKTEALYAQATQVVGDCSQGVKVDDLDVMEKVFSINILVYSLKEFEEDKSVKAVLIRRSHRSFPDTLYLNLFEIHFSYIKDFNVYAHTFVCERCNKCWNTRKQLERHLTTTCTKVTREKFVGGSYQPEMTVFDHLEDHQIEVPFDLRFYPYRMTYDFETYFDCTHLPCNTEKVEWKRKHVPLSVSVASNVPGYEDPVCFISKGDPEELILKMITYMLQVQQVAEKLVVEKHESYVEELTSLREVMNQLEGGDQSKHPLDRVKKQYEDWLRQIPVLGFNSGSYDINLIKPHLIQVLAILDPVGFVVKRCNNFMCLSTARLKLLDVRNYLAPGFSYANYLKAYQCSQDKGFFPYEWVDSLDKLQHPKLPEQKEFWTELTNKTISDEEYQICQQAWEKNEMKTFQDYLVWYNNLDVVPFLEALEKQFTFYKNELKVDMFKDGISVPGLTLKYLFQTLDHKQDHFVLFNERDKDVHKMVKENLVGGPSIIFHCYHEVGETHIRGGKLCEGVIGYDANALYLSCLMREMPTGMYTRRRAENQFKPEVPDLHGRLAVEWLDWESEERQVFIRHKYNGKEKKIGKKQVCVDGWCAETNTVFQFHGCFWHGHECQEKKGVLRNNRRKKTMVELRSETRAITQYIQKCGYHLEEKWECEWKQEKKEEEEKRTFVKGRFRKPLDFVQAMTQEEVLEAIHADELFGMVECDVHVPEALREVFAEMPPIFKNTEVGLEDVSDSMREYAVENQLLKQSRRTLIGSFIGDKILLITPLLKWYVDHGLKVTKIHQTLEFLPKACFKAFGNKVSSARRAGDVDVDQTIIADTMKLLGNSGYGKTITNKSKHRNIKFCLDEQASMLVNEPWFRQLNVLQENLYEVEMAKKVIQYDLPLHIGFFVYQYAKLRMLEFYFDFMMKFLAPEDFQYIEMDTDSAYIALSKPSLEECVREDKYVEFWQEWNQWFPAEACDLHQQVWQETKRKKEVWHPEKCCQQRTLFDKRTPGLFKVEWEGQGMVALCSKTYFGWGRKEKYSCKGLRKSANHLNKDKYLEVLQKKQAGGGVNVGFQVHKNALYTYRQERDSLSYLYIKRKVCDDGVSTEPLLI